MAVLGIDFKEVSLCYKQYSMLWNIHTPRLARIEDQKHTGFAEPQRDVIPLDHTTD
ncbi:predicted protein [Plenodomus lingam JN3]|uniref:Predicted protein n=1 Tax=Leptosphaeria maculans (strain JN3 / isolate v23.1.3 / race Av1-4-5-6-7-8) TaxID=985895 RepID=E4ZN43_LEPMJ|nr:predicted protein [Plenodomus lingam JN3]CBX92646.1 predicted protein [Plenodomus lingam JN3]